MVKDMAEIYKCKYLLPCGHCDKYNIICEVNKTIKSSIKSYCDCQHDWTNRCGITDTKANIEYSMYICSKCGDVKAEKFAI